MGHNKIYGILFRTAMRILAPRLRFTSKCRLVFGVSVLLMLVSWKATHDSSDSHYRQQDEKTEENSIANKTWVQMRKKALAERNVSKVFLFSYMRGGSSLFAAIFNLHPSNSLMFYEPLDAFYQSYAGLYPNAIPLSLIYEKNFTQRSLGDRETVEMTDYLESLYTCSIDKLPIETFAHNYFGFSSAFSRPAECMTKRSSKEMLSRCIDQIRSICGNEDIIRRSMSTSIANKCPQIIRALQDAHITDIQSDSNGSKPPKIVIDFSAISRYVRNTVEQFSAVDYVRLPNFINYHICKTRVLDLLRNCMGSTETICRKAQIIALKVIRSRMKDLEGLIQRIPDIHILYYVRDPRAIAVSRLQVKLALTFSAKDKRASSEAKLLCRRMWKDIKARKVLERKYPGSITTIRYEDFVRDLNGISLRVFEKIGHPPPSTFWSWLKATQTGSSFDGPFGIQRPNRTSSITRWKGNVTFQDGVEMTRHCRSLLIELGYELY